MTALIKTIYIEKDANELQDLSHIGAYGNKPTSIYAIDRLEKGDWLRGEHQYFNPSTAKYKGLTEEEIKIHSQNDYRRMEDYNDEKWVMMGIRAVAVLEVGVGGIKEIEIRSGGVHGIESDVCDDFLYSVVHEEIGKLFDILSKLGLVDDRTNWVKKANEAISEFLKLNRIDPLDR